MESKAKVLGHPIHPMLIVLPLGLLSAAVIFDILHLFTGNDTFAAIAFWNIAAGIVGGLAAGIFGLIDWINIPSDTRAKRIGMLHGGGNAVVLVLFGIAWVLRLNEPGFVAGTLPLALEIAAAALAMVTGWLGGELVDRLGVGVDPGANLNSPNSLSGRPASDTRGVGGQAPVTRR